MTTATLRSPTGVFVEFFAKLLVAAVLMLGTQVALAADPVYTGTFSNKALSGYDAVAYHTQGEAVKGDRDFSTEYNGAADEGCDCSSSAASDDRRGAGTLGIALLVLIAGRRRRR